MALWSSPATVRDMQLSTHGDLTVTERLATLLDTGDFADVTIRVGAGGEAASFKAHRLLLASASQPLHRLVTTLQAGHQDLSNLRVTDVPPHAFRNVLKFIYTDEVCIDSIMDAFELLKAGKKWNLQKLNERTVEYLDHFLDTYSPDSEAKKNEIFNLILLAQSHSEELFEKCLKTIVKFCKDIIPCEGYLSIDAALIKRIFSHEDFQYDDQLKLFESIKDWGMNQILQKGLNPSRLHRTIEDLLNYVSFDKIQDKDFMGTILPSECLSRAEVIAFFMSRGMNIPRDNVVPAPGADDELKCENVARFKKGYKLPNKEIYQSHEARFMVEQGVRLLGVGFGYLFSNTDMGVTIHIQGPWERQQWTDITQTYCRVSHEQMTSANLRLLFAAPVRLEARHSYKVMVKITRMTAGSSEVELWGGKEGVGSVKKEDATFYFIKAAVKSDKDVEPQEMDTKEGMITELLYVLDDDPQGSQPESVVPKRSRPVVSEEEVATKKEVSAPSFMRKRPSNFEDSLTNCSTTPTRRRTAGTYSRWQPTSSVTSSSSSIYPSTDKTHEAADLSKNHDSTSAASSYIRKRPTVVIEEKPAFLRSRVTTPIKTPELPFGERLGAGSRPSWRTRAKPTETTVTATPPPSRYAMTNGHTTSQTSTDSQYSSNRDGKDGSSQSSLYGTGLSSNNKMGTYSSRTNRDAPTYSSRYGKDSSHTKESSTPTSCYSSSRYSRDSSMSKEKPPSTTSSLYPRSSPARTVSDTTRQSTTSSLRPSLNRSDSITSRSSRERDASANRFGREKDLPTSRVGRERYPSTSISGRNKESTGNDRDSSRSRLGGDSRSSTSRDGSVTSLATSRFGRDGSSSRSTLEAPTSSLRSRYGSTTSSLTNGYGNDTSSAISRLGKTATPYTNGKTATPYTNGYGTGLKTSSSTCGKDNDSLSRGRDTDVKASPGKYSSRVRDLSSTRYGSYGSSPYTSSTYGSGYSPGKYSSSYSSRYR